MIKVTSALRSHLEKLLPINLDSLLSDERLPKVICTSCKRIIYRKISEKDSESANSEPLRLPDYSKFQKPILCTRSQTGKCCECYLCELARWNVTKPLLTGKKSSSPKCVKLCSKCFIVPKRGTPHKCTKAATIRNLHGYVDNSLGQKLKEQLTVTLVKDISNKQLVGEKKQDLPISLTQPAGGKAMKIIVNPSSNATARATTPHLLSGQDFVKIKTQFNLSSKTTLGIASALRVASKKRTIIEPGLKKTLERKNLELEEFFSVKKLDFLTTKSKISTLVTNLLVYCNNLENFIEYIETRREIGNHHLKVGIDGGGGFLKVCLSIQALQDKTDQKESKRQKYDDGVCAKTFKDSGVKKLFILGIAKSTQENYDNVSEIWKMLNINDFSCTIATDLKLANILLGIMSHSSSYPCTWCFCENNNLENVGSPRTIGNCTSYFEAWRNAGSTIKNAKNYKNCINLPVFTGDENTRILEIIPPPELHLMLGVMNKIVNHMQGEFSKETNEWTNLCNVQREITHGGTGFKGNSCKILLNKVDSLRAICAVGCLKYVETLQDFQRVVNECFGTQLNPSYRESIKKFKSSYLALGISVTPKVHAVFYHIEDFCENSKRGLGFYSEQAMESVHSDFKTVWNKYKVSETHSDYDSRLLKAVIEYNSNHI